ncbi:transcriptional regulator, AraC family [Duganella sp. CF458]|uniref:AraC family transcriptional regulator n=1 Tax=Duganella sp. CF458 TaxID=1884368 RepID=UPI0008EF178D|nr:helix-turn-helix domain-containing protein [Duganella sp. CF458]SFG78762.1 transcriptional regulator, AraC family [Duganella sp. CF458]
MLQDFWRRHRAIFHNAGEAASIVKPDLDCERVNTGGRKRGTVPQGGNCQKQSSDFHLRGIWQWGRQDIIITMLSQRWHLRPAAQLRPYIDRYWGWEGKQTLPPHLPPGTGSECIFHYGSPFLLDGKQSPRAVLLCLRTRAIAIEGNGLNGFVAVRFRGGSLRHFCGKSLSHLHDQHWPAHVVWGDSAERLSDQLALADGPAICAAALDRFFLACLGQHEDRGGRGLDTLLEKLYYAPATSIDALAAQSGWTRRHLQRRFTDTYGLGPKQFARIARLSHTLRMLALAPEMPALDAAMHMGYYDQPHFIHETRALTGHSPQTIVTGMRQKSHFYNPPSRPVS